MQAVQWQAEGTPGSLSLLPVYKDKISTRVHLNTAHEPWWSLFTADEEGDVVGRVRSQVRAMESRVRG